MGKSGWDDEALDRGRSPRTGRARDGERPGGGPADRSGRGGHERSDRPERRSRDDWDAPVSGRSGSRGGSDPARPRRDDFDRAPAPPPGRPRSGGSGVRPPSSDRWDDDGRAARPSRDPRAPERSGRSPRPSTRDDDWDAPPRRGSGGSSVRGGGAAAGGVARGGLWDDEEPPRRRRPDGGDPRGRGAGGRPGMDPRDPRGLRRGLVQDDAFDDTDDEASGGLNFGGAVVIILAMFIVGAGVAFGYFKLTTPKPPVETIAPAATAPASASPTVAPSPTKTGARLLPASQVRLVYVARA